MSFGDLQNYTTLKRVCLDSAPGYSFGDLQNYTTLKRLMDLQINRNGFGDLQNYTTLKLKCLISNVSKVLEIYRITLLSNV